MDGRCDPAKTAISANSVRIPRNIHEEDLHAAPTLANYEAYLKNEFLK